jgi:TfoX/Sxy family transcriptional regulator of competence genes
MKSTPFLEYVRYDVLNESLNITVRAMMGGYVLYSNGKVFAIVDDETLWFKGSKGTEAWYIERGSKKFSYTKTDTKTKKKKTQSMNYFLVPEDILEDREVFAEWVGVALSV